MLGNGHRRVPRGVTLLALLGLLCAGCRHRGETPLPAPEGLSLGAGADLHAHVLMRSSLRPFFQGEPDSGVLATSPSQFLVNPLDSASLRQAGVQLVVAALWPRFDLRPGRSARDEALGQVRALRDFVRRRPAFALAMDAASARTLMARGRIALLPALEGGAGILRVEDVDLLYAAGIRSIGLVHFTDNALGDARDAQLGGVPALLLDGPSGGLTPLGQQVVRRMMSLGMVVDVSHASEQTMAEVLDITERAGVPVIASHEGAAHGMGRTLSVTLAARIAASGGLIGVGVYRSPIADPVPQSERWEGFQPGSCDDVVAHWLHFQRAAGAQALVLGSDLGAPVPRPLPGRGCSQGLRNTGDLRALFATLVEHGVPGDVLGRSAERVLALLERVEARADPSAVAAARRLRVPESSPFDVPL